MADFSFLVFMYVLLIRVKGTNITLISMTFMNMGRDGFLQNNPAYDVVLKDLSVLDRVFSNITHIPVRCSEKVLTIGDQLSVGDFAGANADEYLSMSPDALVTPCFFKLYYLHPEYFTSKLEDQFTVLTTPCRKNGILNGNDF